MSTIKHIENRKSKQLADAYPPELFVPYHRWLVVWDLQPGQWSLSPDGEIMARRGERCIEESKGSVIE